MTRVLKLKLYPLSVLLLLQVLSFSGCAWAQESSSAPPLVLVALAPLYQLTLPLLADTPIQLEQLPESPRSMQTHKTLFTRQIERFADQFRAADAVITIGQIWAQDPLFISARSYNIRIVNIDASKPFSHELDGVAVAQSPVDGQVSPYFWLSPSNVIRTLDIIAADLMALYPAQAAQIQANLDQQRTNFFTLKTSAEQALLEAEDPQLYALADEFVYLTSDIGIFVDGYFVKQDIDWTTNDYRQLTARLQQHGVKLVIHKWLPSPEIQQAISASGAQLVILDTLETTTDFAGGLKQNLQALSGAFGQTLP